MATTHTQRKPTFLWQGVFILLPVAALAVFSLVSLRRDAQTAEQDARQRAAENTQGLARAMRSTVDEDLQRYLNLQFLRLMRIRTTAVPGDYQEFPNASLKIQTESWERDYPRLDLAGYVAAQGLIWADGREIEPPDAPAAPLPPQWFLKLSPPQKALWEKLRRAINAETEPASVRKATQAFLESNPSDESKQAAYALSQPLEQVAQYSGPLATETGLSFGEIACFQMLSKPDARLTDALYRAVYSQIIFHPSIVTPRLLEMAGALTNRTDVYLGPKIVSARQLWDSQARTREWLVPLRGLPGLTNNWSPSAKWAHWTGSPAGEVLAFFSAGTSNNVGNNPSETNVSGRCWEISFVPQQVVEAIFARALKQNQFLVPEYASVEATVEGTPLHLPGQANHGPATALLGMADEHFGVPMPSEAAGFQLRFYLTSREQMLSMERRRARLFGALILLSGIAAAVGLLAAYRAFRGQLHLNELKTNFVSSVSHELRAPIASVRLMAENLERGKIPDAPRQGEYFRFIVQECRRLTSLIENVLDFSRIEQGRKEYEFEPTDLVALAETTVKLMEPYAAEKGVRLELAPPNARRSRGDEARIGSEVQSETPHVVSYELNVDGRAVQQALVNLIDNAIKHSPKGETVEVEIAAYPCKPPRKIVAEADSLRAPRSALRISVSDRGPGIPRAEHEKIFERFYRRGSELRRETQGVGIGLSIVKHAVEAHGGRVLVESEPGQGSRFTIELPFAK